MGAIVGAVRRFAFALALALCVAESFSGCSITPAETDAIRQVWAERDAERAAECRRRGMIYAAGGCLIRGGP